MSVVVLLLLCGSVQAMVLVLLYLRLVNTEAELRRSLNWQTFWERCERNVGEQLEASRLEVDRLKVLLAVNGIDPDETYTLPSE